MTLRVGLLGCGGIGARHAGAIQAVDGLDLVACCGRDAQRTADFAAKFGGTAYTDFARMLDEARLDLLVVALPPYAHAGEVELAAARGVNLLVEKPIALTLDRAESMVAATQGVVVACGFMYRFGAAVERWDALSAAGATGAVGHFSGSFHSNALHAPWWRARDKSGCARSAFSNALSANAKLPCSKKARPRLNWIVASSGFCSAARARSLRAS